MQTVPDTMLSFDPATQTELDAVAAAEVTARNAAIAAAVPAVIAAAPHLTSATAQASTSGTALDFNSIPSWVKRITVMLAGVSTNGASVPQIQIGDSGGIETTGYLGTAGLIQNASASATTAFSAGFILTPSGSAASVIHGAVTLALLDASTNTWVATGVVGFSNSSVPVMIAGSKSLSATLDRVRITAANGTDLFDAGSVNINYE